MLIDIIYLIVLVLAVFRGSRQGLIVGVFSLVAVIIGLAAALKLSAVTADYIGSKVNISKEWLPLVSFALVFLLVVVLIRLGAKALEGAVKTVMLGWVNTIGGILLFVIIYTLVFSVFLFYAEQMKWFSADTISHSMTYSFVQPWGPKVINAFGSLIPLFKDLFGDLENFFGHVAGQVPRP
ncbi:MAG: CvpA family protein [Chitinophagaceae bacterium]|nr:CvpA family protein [Chitinophagaceae bacterium]